jgi:uncharacterized membrane protein YsdA (DUF1294 family)
MTHRFGIVIFVIAALGAVLLATLLSSLLNIFWAWLLAINLVAFLTYGYDKMIAGSQVTRVPEAVLLLLAVFGGFVGAALGMWIFRHKTRKTGFQVRFVVAVVLGIIFVVAFFYLTNTLL